ncbi:hypothetical protein [Bacillus sp. 03113]|uniref:hypothetical protein n=1 Tax=Bacillus sp. 03113 TaxID=2578211 RepID=UPI0015E8C7AA|nr:hypothetical protein [Bacillus sp. 03113]
MKEKFLQFKQMEGLFFDKIFVFNTDEFYSNDINTNEGIGKYLIDNKINLQEFSDIIAGSSNSHFEIYLVENKINFTFLKEASRLIRHDIAERKLDSGFIEKVLVLFGIDQKIQINENSTILLTQHFSNLTFEEHKKIYQLVVDYLVPETRLVIYPHPDDLMFYDALFPKATVIKKNFPSELIPFAFAKKPQTVMTITSTSINNHLMGYFENCITFSTDFERYFTITHKYYCAVKVISELFEDYEIYELNSDKLLLENFSGNQFGKSINSVNHLSQIPKKSIVIIDDISCDTFTESNEIYNFLTSLDEESIIIFLNSNKRYLFYNYPNKEVFESIMPIEILHSSTIDETEKYSNTFFIFSKRKDTRNMINDLTFEKTLRSSKERIKVEAMSEEQLRIKVLEGILEATEKRLEHYIKLELELREKLNLKMT